MKRFVGEYSGLIIVEEDNGYPSLTYVSFSLLMLELESVSRLVRKRVSEKEIAYLWNSVKDKRFPEKDGQIRCSGFNFNFIEQIGLDVRQTDYTTIDVKGSIPKKFTDMINEYSQHVDNYVNNYENFRTVRAEREA